MYVNNSLDICVVTMELLLKLYLMGIYNNDGTQASERSYRSKRDTSMIIYLMTRNQKF